MGTFEAIVSPVGERKALAADLIGQLAVHLSIVRDGSDTNCFTLSHVASGYRIWSFEEWVSPAEVRRLARLLETQDFDAYMRGGYQDKAFIAECKRIEDEWEATYPDRLAYDRLVEAV